MEPKPEMMAAKLIEVCKKKNFTVATAESCSAGGVASRIASIPGASAVLAGGIVAYTEEAKRRNLAVPEELLAQHGAVSAECAMAMALGAKKAFNSDYAVSVTGFAGPDGGTEENPIGTVYIGIATPQGERFRRMSFDGNRQMITDLAVELAVVLLLAAVVHSLRPTH